MANIQTAMKTPWINHIFSGCRKHSRAQFSTDADRQLERVHFVLISSRYEFNSFDFEGWWWNVSMHTLKFTQGRSERIFHAFRKGQCFLSNIQFSWIHLARLNTYTKNNKSNLVQKVLLRIYSLRIVESFWLGYHPAGHSISILSLNKFNLIWSQFASYRKDHINK